MPNNIKIVLKFMMGSAKIHHNHIKQETTKRLLDMPYRNGKPKLQKYIKPIVIYE
jgi:hypothetical protein